MNLKIVYVVIANSNSTFLEEAYASIWSLKYYNPSAHITIVMDDSTKRYYDDSPYDELKSLVDEVKSITLNEKFSNLEKSRWLKTSLRQLISGDYLFMDTDTIITGDISDIDNFNGIIGAVPDWHRNIKQYDLIPAVRKCIKKYFPNLKITPHLNYYNSGVMVVRDTETAYEFYKLWHNNWETTNSMGFKFDQIPLFATDITLGGIISPIEDIYNYQVSETLKYLYSAKIIHFYLNGKNTLLRVNPFFNEKWYLEIKDSKTLSSSKKEDIINCKNLFHLETQIIAGQDIKIWQSPSGRWLRVISNFKLLMKFQDFICRSLLFVMRKAGYKY